MDGTDFRQFTDSLSDYDLLRLAQAVHETQANRDELANFQRQFDLTTSNTNTYHTSHPPFSLEESDRLTYQARSTLSGDTILPLPNTGRDSLERDISKQAVVLEAPHSLGSPQLTVQGTSKKRTTSEQNSQPTYFCTYCEELGTPKSFRTKHDWKRHEKDFHETGYEWPCQTNDCLEVFNREKDFRFHFEKAHRRKPHTRETKVALPDKRVWACGFENCRKLTYSWNDRCNHVATCMREGRSQWSYTWKILALLRHPDIYPTWKRVKANWWSKIDTSSLDWDCKTSRKMRQQLECLHFPPGASLEAFLERLLKLGLQYPHSVTQNLSPHQPEGLPSHPTFASLSPHFGLQNDSTTYEASRTTSYADQRHAGNPSLHETKRNSVTMLDAPSAGSDGQNDTTHDQEMLTFHDFFPSTYAVNTTPPLSDPFATSPLAQDTSSSSRTSPRCKLVRKGSKWLTPKRSQQFHQQQRIVTDHPDLGLGYSVPGSDPERPYWAA